MHILKCCNPGEDWGGDSIEPSHPAPGGGYDHGLSMNISPDHSLRPAEVNTPGLSPLLVGAEPVRFYLTNRQEGDFPLVAPASARAFSAFFAVAGR